jgi:hypothetical protein
LCGFAAQIVIAYQYLVFLILLLSKYLDNNPPNASKDTFSYNSTMLLGIDPYASLIRYFKFSFIDQQYLIIF